MSLPCGLTNKTYPLAMRRADRLFQIVQLLRSDRVVTGQYLADELEVSTRTIYRDIQDLSLSGVPIEGEAGVGYRLMRGFHMPPLMFSEEELAALLIGARMVQAWTDPKLAKAAQGAINKIDIAIPEHLKPELNRRDVMVPDFNISNDVALHLEQLRAAVKQQHKIRYDYQREDGQQSQRTVHPLGMFYWGRVWTMIGWCELRDAFRHFRLDRMSKLEVLSQHYTSIPGRTLDDYLSTVCNDP